MKMIDPDPDERYNAELIGEHPWITRQFDQEPPMTRSE